MLEVVRIETKVLSVELASLWVILIGWFDAFRSGDTESRGEGFDQEVLHSLEQIPRYKLERDPDGSWRM